MQAARHGAARRKLRSSATATKARRRYELPTTSFISGQGRANRGALGEPNTDAGAGNVSFSLKPGKYAQAQAEHPLNREESLQAALDQLDAQETLAQQDIAISSNSRCDSSNIPGRINRRAECSLMRQSSSGSFVSTLKA